MIFFLAQLLISKTASFEFNNLKDAFISLKPNKSTTFFIEVLKNILGPNENNKHVSYNCDQLFYLQFS